MKKRLIIFLLLFVLSISAIYFIQEKKITGYQVQQPPVASNTITITEEDGVTTSNYPISIGRIVAKGEIAGCPQAVISGQGAVLTQVDEKNRWGDGSFKFGLVSFNIPTLQANSQITVSFVNQPCGQSTPQTLTQSQINNLLAPNFNFEAQMQLTQVGPTQTVSARQMLQNGDIIKVWAHGPVSTTIVLGEHINGDYDLGWKQRGELVLSFPGPGGYPAPATTFYVVDGSWADIGESVYVGNKNRYVPAQVVSVDLVSNPHSITVSSPGYHFEPNDYVYISETAWLSLTNSQSDEKYKSFRPLIHATFFPASNKVKVKFIGEIANTEKLQSLEYDLSLAVGQNSLQTPVYTQSNIDHYAKSRWAKDFWIGRPPSKISINHNMEYIKSTDAIYNYKSRQYTNAELQTQYNSWLTSMHNLFDFGNIGTASMGEAASHWKWHSPVSPEWDVTYLNTGDWRMLEVMTGNAYLSSAWPVHIREGDSGKYYDYGQTISALGKPANIRGRPSLWINSLRTGAAQDRIIPVGHRTYGYGEPLTDSGWDYTSSHIPEFYYLGYILLGDYYLLEEEQFWTSYAPFYDWPQGRGSSGGLTGQAGIINNANGPAANVRSWARVLQQRANTAFISEDGSAEKSYSIEMIYEALAAFEGNIGNAIGPSLYQTNPQAFASVHSRPGDLALIFNWARTHPIAYSQGIGPNPPNPSSFNFATDEGGYTNTLICRGNILCDNPNANPPIYSCPSSVCPNGVCPPTLSCPGGSELEGLNSLVVRNRYGPWMQSYWMGALMQAHRLGFPTEKLLAFQVQNYLILIKHPIFTPFNQKSRLVEYVIPTISRLTNNYFQSVAEFEAAFDSSNSAGVPIFTEHLGIHTIALAAVQYSLDREFITSTNTPLSPILTSMIGPGLSIPSLQGLEVFNSIWVPYLGQYGQPKPNWDVTPPPIVSCPTVGATQTCSVTGQFGVCSIGRRTCIVGSPSNTWSSCVALPTSIPSQEICGNNVDEDCDGILSNGCACSTFSNAQICASNQVCFGGTFATQSSDPYCCVGGLCQSGPTIPSGLVAAYNFEEVSGTTANDVSGNGNNGNLLNGVQRVPGKYGQGVSLDGINDYIFVADSPSLNPTNSLTISAWVYNPVSGMVARKGDLTNQYQLRVGLSDVRFLLNGVGPTTTGLSLTSGVWHHIAGTYDGTQAKIYVDGVQFGPAFALSGPILQNSGELDIGRRFPGELYYGGLIDEVRIYNRGLTPAEITNDMALTVTQGGVPNPPGGLNANYIP